MDKLSDRDYLLAGRSYFSLQSSRTHLVYSFKILQTSTRNWDIYLQDSSYGYLWVGSYCIYPASFMTADNLVLDSKSMNAVNYIGQMLLSEKYNAAYGVIHRSQYCPVCGKLLTSYNSRKNNIGKTCYKKYVKGDIK